MDPILQLLEDAAKYIFEHKEELGNYISVVVKGVTSIKRFENRTDMTLRLWKVDKKPLQPDTQ